MPTALIVGIPTLYLLWRVLSRRRAEHKLKTEGIGRGAPGFLTGVKKVALPRDIAERIKRGEEVSAEEVTLALERERAKAEGGEVEEPAEEMKGRKARAKRVHEEPRPLKVPEGVDEEWLPKGATTVGGSGAGKGRRRKK